MRNSSSNKRLLEAYPYEHFSKLLTKEEYDQLISIDQTQGKKYANWILDNYKKKVEAYKNSTEPMSYPEMKSSILSEIRSQSEDLAEAIILWDKYKKANVLKDDINSVSFTGMIRYIYRNRGELETALKMKNAHKEVITVYKDKEHLLVIPKSYEASVKYGTHTSWCTANPNSQSYFNSYDRDGTLYIHRFLTPDGSWKDEAYQLYVPGEQASSMNELEIKDSRNNNAVRGYDRDELDDTIFQGIPEEIADKIWEKVELANEEQPDITINMSSYWEEDKTEKEKYSITGTYSVSTYEEIYYHRRGETEEGDRRDYNEGRIKFTLIGNLRSQKSQEGLISLDPNEFNWLEGDGLLVEYLDGESITELSNVPHDNDEDNEGIRLMTNDLKELIELYLKKTVENLNLDFIVFSGDTPKSEDFRTFRWLLNNGHAIFDSKMVPGRMQVVYKNKVEFDDFVIFYDPNYQWEGTFHGEFNLDRGIVDYSKQGDLEFGL